MKSVKTYVITKKALIKAAIVLICFIILAAMLIPLLLKNESDEAIAAFSVTPEEILDEGTVNNKNSSNLKDTIKTILGFDINEPDTIIKSSSATLKKVQESEETNTVSPTEMPKEMKTLPIKNEIENSVGLKINNATNYQVDIDKLCSEKWDEQLFCKEPEVLIVHTHTTECYIGDEMTGESERTTNETQNMCRVGDEIAKSLESYGIKTIHDKTIHDYPTYQGSYTRALRTIEKNLAEYPSIKLVLDIHRDAYIYADGSKLRVKTEIDGEEIAQVMLVLGTDSMGLKHDFWRSNLILASKIQNAAEIMYPGMMRPLNLRRERFNMHLTKGSLLLEIGSNGNRLEEAEKAGEYIGTAIAAVLLNG